MTDILCFYSKYSSRSKKLIDQAKTLPLKYFCVDNSIARERIKTNSNLKIQYVPCILVLYKNGVVEKYEGEHAFRWVEEQLPPQPAPQPAPIPIPVPVPDPQNSGKTSISTLTQEKEEKKKPLNVKDIAQKLLSERENMNKPKT